MDQRYDVVVIGAGIVGMACARQLQHDGRRVAVIDPEPPGSMTSFGNAGAISAGSCVPMSGPGVLKQVPKWLLDPLGPLAIQWHHLPTLMPWLLRFVASGEKRRVAAQAQALRALHEPAVAAHLDLAREAGAEDLIHRNGALYVYETEAGFAGDARGRALMRDNGVELQELQAEELRQLEPDLAPIFVRGTFIPQNAHCGNPGGLVERLGEAFRRDGGTILPWRVGAFDVGPDGVRGVLTDGGKVLAGHVVLAAGVWSYRLSRLLGDEVPLESERGYHMTLPHAGATTRRPITFMERRFMCTPMDMGLRLAGTVEFAGLDSAPNYARAEKLLTQAQDVFRTIDTGGGTRWMGNRPATPDSLPVIGRATRHRNVVHAFGHGHLGLTGAATTARHVADLVAERAPAIDLTMFRVDRF